MGRPSLSMVGSCVRGSRQRKRALARPVLSSSGRTTLLAPARSNGLLLAFLAWRHEEATLLEFAEEAITDTVLLIAPQHVLQLSVFALRFSPVFVPITIVSHHSPLLSSNHCQRG